MHRTAMYLYLRHGIHMFYLFLGLHINPTRFRPCRKLHGLLRSPSAHSPHWSSSIFIDAHDPFGAAICCRAHGETEGPRLVGSSEELPGFDHGEIRTNPMLNNG